MNTRYTINPSWAKYDQLVARNMLKQYGVIFLDEYGLPIDNEREVDELFQKWERKVK